MTGKIASTYNPRRRYLVDGRLKLQTGDRVKVAKKAREEVLKNTGIRIEPSDLWAVKKIYYDVNRFYADIASGEQKLCMGVGDLIYHDTPESRNSNPIRKVKGGWQWGHHGKIYKDRKDAVKQMRAAYWSGYKGKSAYNPRRIFKSKVSKLMKQVGVSPYDIPMPCPICEKSVLVSEWYEHLINTHKLTHTEAVHYLIHPSKKNPESLYEAFHRVSPIRKRKVFFEPPNGELVKIGDLSEIRYRPTAPSKYAGTEFFHKSGDVGSNVLKTNLILATDKSGKNLYLVKKDKNVKRPYFSGRGIIG